MAADVCDIYLCVPPLVVLAADNRKVPEAYCILARHLSITPLVKTRPGQSKNRDTHKNNTGQPKFYDILALIFVLSFPFFFWPDSPTTAMQPNSW